MENSLEWVDAVVKRLSSSLPHRIQNQLWTSTNEQIIEQTVKSIVDLSQDEFPSVICSLSVLLQELNKSHPPGTATEVELLSYCTVLDCLTQCLAERGGSATLNDEDIHALQQLYQRITHLCLLHRENTESLSMTANKVLYQLSGLHFHGIFNKIILRMTSVNRLAPFSTSANSIPELPSSSTTSSDQLCVIGLIPHLNLNASRLQQILQAIVTSFKDLHKRNKQLFLSIPPMLHKSIWNFIQEYPSQFNEVLNNSYPSLERSAEKLFNLCDEYADNNKKKVHIWPLQNAALILCPKVLKDITECVDKSSPTHRSQRSFVASLQKVLSSGKREKELTETALICAIDLFKAGSFVGDRSTAFFRYFITLMQGQLHSLLFSPSTPFLHNSCSVQAAIPTFTDRDLMTNCLVAQFRCNHRNSHMFTICLDPNSPVIFRLAFVDAMHTVIKETSMSWWPCNTAIYVYSPQLRQIFKSTLPLLRRHDTSNPSLIADVKAYLTSPTTAASMLQAKGKNDRKNLVEMVTNYQLIRGLVKLFSLDPMLAFSSLKENDRVGECLAFMTGLVSLIQHQSIPYMPLRVSEVLLLLHKPENIELWDEKDSMTAFWDISGQVTYSVAMKLFGRKTSNPIQLLEWLKKILQYRTKFIESHKTEASQGSNCKILQQMYTMLETVLLLFLRNTDIDAVRVAMSCFKYLVLEAELVDPSQVPYAANIGLYRQLKSLSLMPQIGRAAQQKKIRGILKGLVHTPGSALAWEDTYSSWRVTKALLISYQRNTRDDHQLSIQQEISRFTTESLSRNFMLRKTTQTGSSTNVSKEQQLTEGSLQAEILNWTNMTGFLCSLAGVSHQGLS